MKKSSENYDKVLQANQKGFKGFLEDVVPKLHCRISQVGNEIKVLSEERTANAKAFGLEWKLDTLQELKGYGGYTTRVREGMFLHEAGEASEAVLKIPKE